MDWLPKRHRWTLITFIAPIALLAGCVSPAETCAGYGFKPGTAEYANCQMEVDQQNRDRMQRAGAAMQQADAMYAPRPMTTCQQFGNMIQCY